MNSLLDTDLNSHEDAHSGADREISLGTATILGIFFALALVCAGFFGFGYSLGRKSTQNAATSPVPPVNQSQALFNSQKPAAGSQTGHPAQQAEPAADAPATQPPPVVLPLAAAKNGATPADAIILGDRPVGDKPAANKLSPAAQQSAPTQQLATANLQPAIVPTGSYMVQIAAVSTQDIADIEVTALKKYGFDVVVRHEPQDQLLHVQIGPYATHKDAVTMQQIILARGFNAIVK
jgi:DedD protein